jgi:hypothetical protein
MSDRERVRRPEPLRTDPVRHASGVFRGGARAADAAEGGVDAAAGQPFAWRDDDPVGRAVRAGCEVVEQAVRRGTGLGRVPFLEPPWGGAGSGDPARPAGPWSTGQWVDAMTGAFAMWAQWVDGWSAAARSVMAGGAPRDAAPGAWPASPWSSPPPGPAPASPSRPLHVVVEIRAARAACVQLDLVSGIAPGAGSALEIHGLLAPAAAGAPPITEVTVAVAAGQVTVAIGGIDHHPAATYAGAVLAAGRAAGTLTVRLL